MINKKGYNMVDKYASRRKWKNSSGTPIYYAWRNMKRRCYDCKDENFKSYGDRGIIVCDRWLNYDNFFEDMINDYKHGLSIDRIDVNGNYCLENCRWISIKEQQNNKRNNIFINKDGINKTISEWCDFLGLSRTEIARAYKRFSKYGAISYDEIFTIKRLLSKRVEERKNKCEICGKIESCDWYCGGTVCNNCANRAMRLRRRHKKDGITLLIDLESYANLIKKMEFGDE